MPEAITPPHLGRHHFEQEFGPNLVAALDDVSRLIHIAQSLQGMKRSFLNNTDLDDKAARKPARSLLRAAKAAAAEQVAAVWGA